MEERTQIVIDIQLDEDKVADRLAAVNKEMSDLRDENAQLRKDVKAGTKTWHDVSVQLADNEAKLKTLKAEQSALSGQVAQATQKSREYGTSLKEQAAKLNDLRNRYQSLDETQRNSKGGQKMLKEIKDLDEAMKQADAEQGIFGRNVGDYANKMAEAFDKAGVSVNGLKGKFDLLNKNPILFFLGLLVGWFMKLKDRMKDNEKVTASLSMATKKLSPIMEGVGKVVGKLADIFSNVLNWAIEKTIQAIGWLGRTLQKVGSWFGQDWGGGLTEMADAMTQLRNASNDVTEAVETATEATEAYSAAVQEVNEGLTQLKETIEGLPDMKKVFALDVNEETLLDQWRRQMQEADAAAKRLAENAKVMQWHFRQMFGDMGGRLSDDYLDTLERRSNALYNFSQSYKENAQTIESISSSLQSSFGSVAQMYQQLASDEAKTEEERERAAKKARRWSALQIAANSGTAIAKGVASAMDVPWPANLGAIASVMATVLSAIAQAKSLAAESHEQGGVIGGRFIGAVSGHDDVLTTAKRGEMVLNAEQQKQLFDIANGGMSTNLTASLVSALQAMPAPVLDYKEFTDFSGRVASLNETAKLK